MDLSVPGLVFGRSPIGAGGPFMSVGSGGGGGATTPTQALALVRASSQSAQITDAAQTGLDVTTGDFSLGFWIYFTTLPGASESYSIIGKKTAIGTAVGYLVHATATAGAVVSMRGSIQDAGGVTTFLGANDPFVVETWYSVIVAYDRDGNGSIFVNGIANGTPASIATRTDTLANALDFEIGSTAAGANYANIRIIVPAIWSRALTVDDALLYHNSGVPILPSAWPAALAVGRVDAWPFNGDLSSFSGLNTLTNNNSAAFVTYP